MIFSNDDDELTLEEFAPHRIVISIDKREQLNLNVENEDSSSDEISGLDISLVISQAKCTPEEALSALNKHKGDVVKAIMELNGDDSELDEKLSKELDNELNNELYNT